MHRSHPVIGFLLFWGVNTLCLWLASILVPGISFRTVATLLVSGLLLGAVNSFVRPVLLFLTLPLSVVTLGLFVLVINALMLLLVAWLVPGFNITGFWNGFFGALFISVFSFLLNLGIGRR
jgi:putative membrane protein